MLDDGPAVPPDQRGATESEQFAAYPPELAAVRQARHFVEAHVCAAGLSDRADDAGSLVSELAANAVLHARTDFDVHVRVTREGVRVEVHDRSGVPPTLAVPSSTAMGGRGLVLVQSVATRWGSERVAGGKSVWFEVEFDAPATQAMEVEVSVEDLLALWSDHDEAAAPSWPVPEGAPGSPSGTEAAPGLRCVTIAGLPAAELLAAEEAMDDLLRELQLMLLAMAGHAVAPGPTPPEVEVARRLDTAARAFEAGRRQVTQQAMRAVVLGQPRVDLYLSLPASTAGVAVGYREAVVAAEELGRTDLLLTAADALSRHAAVRRRYLDELIRQLPGEGSDTPL